MAKAQGMFKRSADETKKKPTTSSKPKITMTVSTPGSPAQYKFTPPGPLTAPKATMTRPATKGQVVTNDPAVKKKMTEMAKEKKKPELLVKRPTPSLNMAGSSTPTFRNTTRDNRNVNKTYGTIGGKFR